MQQAGTLKKRKKRNLAKVNGLGTVPYTDADDLYDGKNLFGSAGREDEHHQGRYSFETGADTRLRMSAFMHQGSGNSRRATRNPIFHDGDNENPNDGDTFSDRSSEIMSPNLKSTGGYITDRSHLLGNKTVNRLRQLLVLGACSGAFPWSWNKKKYRIDKWSPLLEKLWNLQWLFVTIQTACITVFQFYSWVRLVSAGNISYRGVFMNSMSVYWYICAVYFNINMSLYKDQIRQYVNTMLEFNKKYVDKYLIHAEGYQDGGRVLISLSIPCNCSQVFVSVAVFLQMAYQPWFLFSYIYPKPWYWLIPGALQQFVMAGQVITSFMLLSWIVVAHTNSVDFWLKETHNHNDSDYTTDQLRNPKIALETYRSLQILCTCFNDCMSPLAIPFVKMHIIMGLIPCGYVLIRSMNQIFIDEFPGILMYPIGVIDCATAGFAMMSMGAEMFDLAASFVDSWSRTKQKDFRRILMSFPALKVKVGRFYFVTVTTTITFFKTTFDYIIDCIITFP